MTSPLYARYRAIVEETLDAVLPPADARPARLSKAMRYAVEAGGKRLRPVLALATADALSGDPHVAAYPAAAIELLHNYTLIHDDLPSMDNDTLRRGRPTVWTAFGEANAILAGDALQALAFKTAARAPCNAAAILDVLGERALGVVQGQVEDLARRVDAIDYIYAHKTADLFVAAVRMGALAAQASRATLDALSAYAFHLGLAFQHVDDLLDGDTLLGRDATRRAAETATAGACEALKAVPGETRFLHALAEQLAARTF
jgi:geranylgeranyl pyrophosphate synthase